MCYTKNTPPLKSKVKSCILSCLTLTEQASKKRLIGNDRFTVAIFTASLKNKLKMKGKGHNSHFLIIIHLLTLSSFSF